MHFLHKEMKANIQFCFLADKTALLQSYSHIPQSENIFHHFLTQPTCREKVSNINPKPYDLHKFTVQLIVSEKIDNFRFELHAKYG
jgi:hypothetical protein